MPTNRRLEFQEATVYTDCLAAALPEIHPLAKQKVVQLKSLAGEPFVQFHRKRLGGSLRYYYRETA